jgi:hypothetical protein
LHKRVVERLSDGRRFLMGDAAHPSSPLGGEGLNAALMATERGLADHHALEVSDDVRGMVMQLVALCRDGGFASLPPQDPAKHMAGVRRRLMLAVSYAGSTLVGQAGAVVDGPEPGLRFPARHRLRGTGHHLIVFGETCPDALLARWGQLVSIVDGAGAQFDATEADLPGGRHPGSAGWLHRVPSRTR